jgi:hypothetical protein
MISELNDNEILDFLMNSEFEGDYKPSELKYLLTKWRYFYRILQGRFENVKGESKVEISNLKDDLESIKREIIRVQSISAQKEDLINSMKVRKLTLKERILGKIIINGDEN